MTCDWNLLWRHWALGSISLSHGVFGETSCDLLGSWIQFESHGEAKRGRAAVLRVVDEFIVHVHIVHCVTYTCLQCHIFTHTRISRFRMHNLHIHAYMYACSFGTGERRRHQK